MSNDTSLSPVHPVGNATAARNIAASHRVMVIGASCTLAGALKKIGNNAGLKLGCLTGEQFDLWEEMTHPLGGDL